MPQAARQPEDKELTDRQQRFVDAYVGPAALNASEAVRLAGYKTKNPNDLGYQLRNAPHIRARIDAALNANALTAPEVLILLRRDATRSDAEVLELAAAADEQAGKGAGASMVSSLVSARSTAIQNLARAHGLLTDKQQVDVQVRDHRVIGVAPSALDAMFAPASRTDA
jgi:phage terminase small subunit